MLVTITNRIPKGLEWEILEKVEPLLAALREEGIDRLANKNGFYLEARDLNEGELMWEGYFVDQGDGTTNLYVLGVLKHKQAYYTRLIRVKSVFEVQVAEVEDALGKMITEYLEGLCYELDRTVGPGRGKSGWQSLN